jgi:hypothetical protein
VADRESFHQSGPWTESSYGFKVRSMGRAGMEYVRGSTRFELNSEALATNGFALYRSEIPEDERAQVSGGRDACVAVGRLRRSTLGLLMLPPATT